VKATLTFTARIEIAGINPYVRVRSEQAKALKSEWRRPMPVLVRLNGGPRTRWRTNMMPTGDGDYLLYLHGAMRETSRTGVGDVVSVELSFDDEYRGALELDRLGPEPPEGSTALSLGPSVGWGQEPQPDSGHAGAARRTRSLHGP
jgi:hypothetical protein